MSKSWRADADRVASKRTKANHRQMREQRDHWRQREVVTAGEDVDFANLINARDARRLTSRDF